MYVVSGFTRHPNGESGASPAAVIQDFVHVVSELMIIEYVTDKIIEIAEENRVTVSRYIAIRLAPKIIEEGSMIWEVTDRDQGSFITIDKVDDQDELHVERSLRDFKPRELKSLVKYGGYEEDEEDEEERDEFGDKVKLSIEDRKYEEEFVDKINSLIKDGAFDESEGEEDTSLGK